MHYLSPSIIKIQISKNAKNDLAWFSIRKNRVPIS